MKTFIYGLFSSVFVFFTPTIPLIWLCLFFIIADTLFGMYASYKQKKSVTSRKLARIISKLTTYTLLILLVFALDINILSLWIPTYMMTTKVAAGILCFIEGYSIDEKIRMINNNKGVVYYATKVFQIVKGIKSKYNEAINQDK